MQPGANGENTTRARVDATLLKALALGLYWQQMLDTGRVVNIAERAAAEGLEKVRLQKTLKLARLAPDMVERIASGRDPVGLSFEFFIRRELPDDWDKQRRVIAALGFLTIKSVHATGHRCSARTTGSKPAWNLGVRRSTTSAQTENTDRNDHTRARKWAKSRGA